MERERIIREDYPVENLPEDLREAVGDATRVKVTVERTLEVPQSSFSSWSEMKVAIEKLHASPTFRPVTTEEAVARIRELRDEWD